MKSQHITYKPNGTDGGFPNGLGCGDVVQWKEEEGGRRGEYEGGSECGKTWHV